MSYQPPVYRKQGGAELVIASSGKLNMESGSTGTLAGTVAMSGTLTVSSGGYIAEPVQTLGSSQTATAVTNYGVSYLTGTTTGPSYTLAAPVAGVTKFIALNPGSSGATNRCVVLTNSTGTSINSTGKNQITLATSALQTVTLRGISATVWRIEGVFTSTMGGFATKST